MIKKSEAVLNIIAVVFRSGKKSQSISLECSPEMWNIVWEWVEYFREGAHLSILQFRTAHIPLLLIYLTRFPSDLLRPLRFHLLRYPPMEHKITFVGTQWLNKYFLLHGAFRRILLSLRRLGSLDVWTMKNLSELFLHQNPGSLTDFEVDCSSLWGHKKWGFS